MLQQTQVATAIPYFHRFLSRFPTVEALAAAELEQVLAAWRGLGYYSRARNLHRAARELGAANAGGLPSTARELALLPGFGRYTAGAVASIAFGEQVPAVDGNAARALSRLFCVEGTPRLRETALWELAGRLCRGERPGDLNQALMELGALLCRAETPLCDRCPVRRACRALSHGRVQAIPPARPRRARQSLRLTAAVWIRQRRVLLARREERGLFGGLWELPCSEARGRPDATLRALLGPRLRVGRMLGELKRTLTHRELTLRLYEVSGGRPPATAAPYRELRWVGPASARRLAMSTAMQLALATALRRPLADKRKEALSSR